MAYRDHPPSLVPAPKRTTVRARVRLTERDEHVLRQLGRVLGRAESVAIVRRSAAGASFSNDDWLALYHEIYALGIPSGYAYVIAKEAKSVWNAARQAQRRELKRLEAAVPAIERRLALPIGPAPEDADPRCRRDREGYPDPAVWWRKHTRLQILRARLAKVRADYQAGRVSVCRGGRGLAVTRHHVDASRFADVADWRRSWESARTAISCDGTTGKPFGNGMIRLGPDGRLRICLPRELANLATEARRTSAGLSYWYELECSVLFRYREREWEAAVEQRHAVAYRIFFDPEAKGGGRWYLQAAFPEALPARPATVAEAGGCGIVAVDLNAEHLAVRYVDALGNPTRKATDIPLRLRDLPASTRDARLRDAVEQIAAFAHRVGARAVAIEDLGWGRQHAATGRERLSPGMRALQGRFPTWQFKQRIGAMLARRGLAVVAVRASYSTINGRRYWSDAVRDGDAHQAAAIVLGRRALRLPDRRRTRAGTDPHRRMGRGAPAGEPAAGRSVNTGGVTGTDRTRSAAAAASGAPAGGGVPARGQAPAGPSPPAAARERKRRRRAAGRSVAL